MFNKKDKLKTKKKVSKNMPKFEISKNEKILLGIIAAGAVGFGTYTFAFKPVVAKINPLEKEISTLQASVNNRKNIDEQLKETKDILFQKEKEYNEAIIKVPESDRYPELSKKLHTAAFNNNVRVKSATFGQPTLVNYGDTQETGAENEAADEKTIQNEKEYNDLRAAKNGFYKCTVVVNFEGSFMNVLNFVKAIEGQEQMLELVNISINEEQKATKIDNTKAIEDLEKKVTEKNKQIEVLMAKKDIEGDPVTKAQIQDEIRNQQIERENLKDQINALKDADKEGDKYMVTGGTVTFDYYTKGEQKTENHNFNGGKYGKDDIFK